MRPSVSINPRCFSAIARSVMISAIQPGGQSGLPKSFSAIARSVMISAKFWDATKKMLIRFSAIARSVMISAMKNDYKLPKNHTVSVL